MNDDDDATEFPGILGSYLGAQPGGILAGLFPPQPGYDPQQAAGPAAGATPATPAELAHTLRMIGYQAAALRALGQRADATQTTNTDGSPQSGSPMPPVAGAAPEDTSAGPDLSQHAMAQDSPPTPITANTVFHRSPVPLPPPRPKQPDPIPGVVAQRWPWPDNPDTSTLMRRIAALPTPGRSKPYFSNLYQYGIDPDDLVRRIVRAEVASGDPNAKSGSSSATGLGQFTGDTWREVFNKYWPDLYGFLSNPERSDLTDWPTDPNRKKPEGPVLALRTDPVLARQMTAAYANDNIKALEHANLPVTYRNIYLAHFLGAGGAPKILNADPNELAAPLVPEAAKRNRNVITPTTTVRDLIQWAEDRMEHGAGWRRPSR